MFCRKNGTRFPCKSYRTSFYPFQGQCRQFCKPEVVLHHISHSNVFFVGCFHIFVHPMYMCGALVIFNFLLLCNACYWWSLRNVLRNLCTNFMTVNDWMTIWFALVYRFAAWNGLHVSSTWPLGVMTITCLFGTCVPSHLSRTTLNIQQQWEVCVHHCCISIYDSLKCNFDQ